MLPCDALALKDSLGLSSRKSGTLDVYTRRISMRGGATADLDEDYVLYQVTRSVQRLGITGICAAELKPSNYFSRYAKGFFFVVITRRHRMRRWV